MHSKTNLIINILYLLSIAYAIIFRQVWDIYHNYNISMIEIWTMLVPNALFLIVSSVSNLFTLKKNTSRFSIIMLSINLINVLFYAKLFI